ncbi:hypothetical protein RIF29_41109 [Crotalaria pallida]|uniref:Transmembrane protein n=1 Tax=Crotalaria pallida TaxID=3830 RepID=A0AAN9EAN3_CROPI
MVAAEQEDDTTEGWRRAAKARLEQEDGTSGGLRRARSDFSFLSRLSITLPRVPIPSSLISLSLSPHFIGSAVPSISLKVVCIAGFPDDLWSPRFLVHKSVVKFILCDGLSSRIKSETDKDTELDLESGMPLIDGSNKVSTPGTAKQGKTLLSKISGGFVGGSVNSEDRPSLYCNESDLKEVSVDVVQGTNTPMTGQDPVRRVEKPPVKEKRKKASNKKAAKPPRPPQGPTLDAADHKLIREISEFAMLKRARVERMKALKKMKAAKSSSSSSNSSIWAMIFTVVFVIFIIIQGLSTRKGSVASFQGSPLSTSGTDGGLISVQYQLNPSASDSDAPGSESRNFVQQVAGSDLPEKLRRDSG